MSDTIKPPGYRPSLGLKDTLIAIKAIKDYFEINLARELHLTHVSSPMFLSPATGLNDILNCESAASFTVKETGEKLEIVQSLAKWKRNALKTYGFSEGDGLYTHTNTIRCSDKIDNTHSIYVDQWDWEKVISKDERTTHTLKYHVKKIFNVFKMTEKYIYSLCPQIKPQLPNEISFITSQELEDMYPLMTAKRREYEYAKDKKAVFIMQIGNVLKSGERHDYRAPDNDDWSLNGDMIFYNPTLDIAIEISSMGIRVSEDSLKDQLKNSGYEDKLISQFHRDLSFGKLPYTIGGGLDQSRICMFLLQKAHIGEVQASTWPSSVIEDCETAGIPLL